MMKEIAIRRGGLHTQIEPDTEGPEWVESKAAFFAWVSKREKAHAEGRDPYEIPPALISPDMPGNEIDALFEHILAQDQAWEAETIRTRYEVLPAMNSNSATDMEEVD